MAFVYRQTPSIKRSKQKTSDSCEMEEIGRQKSSERLKDYSAKSRWQLAQTIQLAKALRIRNIPRAQGQKVVGVRQVGEARTEAAIITREKGEITDKRALEHAHKGAQDSRVQRVKEN